METVDLCSCIHTFEDSGEHSIFISSVIVASKVPELQQLGITHVVSACDARPAAVALEYHLIPELRDHDHQNILQHLEQALDFIGDGLRGGSVLVHCMVATPPRIDRIQQ